MRTKVAVDKLMLESIWEWAQNSLYFYMQSIKNSLP